MNPNTTPEEKLVVMLDASALKNSACMMHLYNDIVIGYKPKGTGIDASLLYGSAFHKFAEELAKTPGEITGPLKAAKKYYTDRESRAVFNRNSKHLTSTHLYKTCMDYFDALEEEKLTPTIEPVRHTNTNEPIVELKFALPYRATEKVDVLLAGTIDVVGKVYNGSYVINDYKTSSSWNHKEYFSQYRLDPQLKFYIYAIQRLAEMDNNPASIFKEMINSSLGIGGIITGVFTSASKDTEFATSGIFYFKQDEMDEFVLGLDLKVNKLIDVIEGNYPLIREGIIQGNCRTIYRDCKYSPICGAIDDRAREHLINYHFTTKQYNPLTHGE